MTLRPCFSSAILEEISNILGDTNQGLTGSEIHIFLLQANIDDISEKDLSLSKRKRLYNAFANEENKNKCSNKILIFIQTVIAPSRYVNNEPEFKRLQNLINQQLAFVGYQLKDTGKYGTIDKAKTISDVEIKVENLKQELEKRKAHKQIFKYCTAELLQNNYFHAVFEANKGLFQRIRELSGCEGDGPKLIDQVFFSDPILIINKYQTQSEIDEHNGFSNILKGLYSMFRNTEAHEPAIYWPIEEQDALEILGMISYCHRRLDKAQKIK